MSIARKIIIGSVFTVALAVLIGLAYFVIIPSAAKTQENQNAPSQTQNQAAPELKSFRGVLAGILKDAKEEAVTIGEKIGEAVSNPFSGARNEAPKTPASGEAGDNTFSFAILGDTQRFDAKNPNGNFQKVAGQIKKLNPDLVMAEGDLIGGCEGKSSDAKDYADWKNILGPLTAKTYAVQGNHDRVSDGEDCDKIWQSAFNFPTNSPSGFSELTYSLDFKNSHFVFLDSIKPDGHQISSDQRKWLEQDLAKNKKENTFVIFHEPAFPVSSKITESLDADPAERNALWQILDKYNVTAVINGHEHIVSRRKIDSKVFPGAKNSIYQFVFASTDSFNHDLPKPGVAEYANQGQGRFGLVKVNGKEITVETHDSSGATLDTFSFSK